MSVDAIVDRKMWIPRWQCQVTMIFTPDGVFNSIREFCDVLGVADSRQQREQLQARPVTSTFVKKWPVSTRKGKRETWCIHQDALGFWLALINDRYVRPEFRDTLIEFQIGVLHAAKRYLFGEIEGTIIEPERKIIQIADRTGATITPINLREDDDE